jgi:hypothetical protein
MASQLMLGHALSVNMQSNKQESLMSNTPSKFNWHRPEFMGLPFQVLLKEMDNHYHAYKQWSNPETFSPDIALKYAQKLEALVELCENITVFHVGGGLTKSFPSNLLIRYKTFDVFQRVLK